MFDIPLYLYFSYYPIGCIFIDILFTKFDINRIGITAVKRSTVFTLGFFLIGSACVQAMLQHANSRISGFKSDILDQRFLYQKLTLRSEIYRLFQVVEDGSDDPEQLELRLEKIGKSITESNNSIKEFASELSYSSITFVICSAIFVVYLALKMEFGAFWIRDR